MATFIPACAAIPELKVHYRLPPESDQLKGKQIALSVEDARTTKEILGRGAKEKIGNFSGHFTFSFARHHQPGFKMGLFEAPDMIQEGFKRRLENMGAVVTGEQSPGEPKLLIVLNEFMLDLEDRQWIAKTTYEAKLVRDGAVLSMQTVSVNAQRFKFLFWGEADTILADVFTDMVNRLDVLKLFQRAGLMET
jgi:hypothetical protein